MQMPVLCVHTEDGVREIPFIPGPSLQNILTSSGLPVRSGCGISCGMPAEPGAIYRAERHPYSPGFSCEVIGGGRAQGIYGSGLVDIIASLRKAGILN